MNECPACDYKTDPLKGRCPECGADIKKVFQHTSGRLQAWKITNSSLRIIRGIYLAMILVMLLGWSMDLLYLLGTWVFRTNSSFYETISWISLTSFRFTELGIMIGMGVACFLIPIAPFRNGPISHRMILALRIVVLMAIAQFAGTTFFRDFYFNLFSGNSGNVIHNLLVMGLQWIPWILIVLMLMRISSVFENPNLHGRFRLMMIFLLAQIPYPVMMNTLEMSRTIQQMLGFSGEELIWYQMPDGMQIFIQTGSILSLIASFIYVLMGWIFIGQLCRMMNQILAMKIPDTSAPPRVEPQ